MLKTNCALRLIAAAALVGLSGCGDEDPEIAEANVAAPTGLGPPDAVIIYPAGTQASLETNALRAEVERLRGSQSTASGPGAADGQPQNGSQAQADSGPADGGEPSAAQAGGPSGMAGYDRDNDGRLSPAEYAIHALPGETPARQGATNDENPPYVSDEALNRIATEFSRLDRNGDFYLSTDEFQADQR